MCVLQTCSGFGGVWLVTKAVGRTPCGRIIFVLAYLRDPALAGSSGTASDRESGGIQ